MKLLELPSGQIIDVDFIFYVYDVSGSVRHKTDPGVKVYFKIGGYAGYSQEIEAFYLRLDETDGTYLKEFLASSGRLSLYSTSHG